MPPLLKLLPVDVLRRALQQAVPEGTVLRWEQLGVFSVAGKKLAAMDALSLGPDDRKHVTTLAWPHPQAEIWVQRAQLTEHPAERVFCLLISLVSEELAGGTGVWGMEAAGTMGIDSATAVVANSARLRKEYREDGALSRQIFEGMKSAPCTQLADKRGPYLFACTTGWGDGAYYWDGLLRDGELCGYLCNFVPGEEVASEPAAADGPMSAPVAQRGKPAAVLEAGQVVAIRSAEPSGGWLLVRIVKVTGSAVVVQMPNEGEREIAAQDAIPLVNRPELLVGQRVLTHWADADMKPGTIKAIADRGYRVAWDDHSEPKIVPLGLLTHLAWALKEPRTK